MNAWEQSKMFIDGVVVYYSVLLGRCAAVSVLALGVVLTLRKTIAKDRIFLKGALWGIFLVVPFVGKLRLYYENEFARKSFLWWQDFCIEYSAVRYGYFLGVLIAAIYILHKHWKMKKMLAAMPVETICGQRVYVSPAPMSPFTTGLFNHKVVIPRLILERFSKPEISMILLHENTHIRLGHLWVFFLWELLCTLLWCNPFIWYCARYLKDDMEQICDRVTIQESKGDHYSYGQLIIKSLTLLKIEAVSSATFSGENDYSDTKERLFCVGNYHPYKRGYLIAVGIISAFTILCLWIGVKHVSYPAYSENMAISLVDQQGNTFTLEDSQMLRQAFCYDNGEVLIDKHNLFELLKQRELSLTSFYVVFGGYDKLPGIGGGGNLIYIELNSSTDNIIEVPYQDISGGFSDIFKWL